MRRKTQAYDMSLDGCNGAGSTFGAQSAIDDTAADIAAFDAFN